MPEILHGKITVTAEICYAAAGVPVGQIADMVAQQIADSVTPDSTYETTFKRATITRIEIQPDGLPNRLL